MRRARWFLLLPLLAFHAGAQPKEQPVGLVLMPGDGQLLRAGSDLPLKVKAGEMLFAGDSLRTAAASSTFLFCPEKSSQELTPKSELVFDAKSLKLKSGKLGTRTP